MTTEQEWVDIEKRSGLSRATIERADSDMRKDAWRKRRDEREKASARALEKSARDQARMEKSEPYTTGHAAGMKEAEARMQTEIGGWVALIGLIGLIYLVFAVLG